MRRKKCEQNDNNNINLFKKNRIRHRIQFNQIKTVSNKYNILPLKIYNINHINNNNKNLQSCAISHFIQI